MLLDSFNPDLPLCIDCETIRNHDGLSPFHGDRLCGVAIAQAGQAIYLPLRHRTELELCLPFEETINELREFVSKVKVLRNLNVKFDIHVLEQDDIRFSPSCRFEDTGTLARVVHNRLNDYDLGSLTKQFCTKYKKDAEPIGEWFEQNKIPKALQDYGMVPISIMSKYGKLDALSCLELHSILLGMLPDESVKVWEKEVAFCPILESAEETGVPLDANFFQAAGAVLCKKILHAQQQVNEAVGWRDSDGNLMDFNPGSWKQKNDYFVSKNIAPVSWSDPDKHGVKNPCWDGDALAMLFDDSGTEEAKNINLAIDGMVQYGEAKTAYSTYCTGWMERRDSAGIVHPSYNPGGTKTGRLSSSNPNMQNPPPWALRGMLIPEGRIGVIYDYSQIEYRIFAHFAGDAGLLALYAENPYIDFHQIIANRLGMGAYRDPIKPINFGILYGMGKKKLIRQISKTIFDLNDPTLMEFLKLTYGNTLEEISTNILEEYHRLTPAVKSLLKQVKQAIHAKGYIRNLYQRHLQFDIEQAYVALNYLCQGSAADLFKERSVAVFEDPQVIESMARMVLNIHDSIGATVPSSSSAQLYWDRAKVLAVDVPKLRVPILVDGKVALDDWSNTIEIGIKGKDGKLVRERSIEECIDLLKAGQGTGRVKWQKKFNNLFMEKKKK